MIYVVETAQNWGPTVLIRERGRYRWKWVAAFHAWLYGFVPDLHRCIASVREQPE